MEQAKVVPLYFNETLVGHAVIDGSNKIDIVLGENDLRSIITRDEVNGLTIGFTAAIPKDDPVWESVTVVQDLPTGDARESNHYIREAALGHAVNSLRRDSGYSNDFILKRAEEFTQYIKYGKVPDNG